MPEYIDITITW